MNNVEIWKPIKGYEGLYEVSNLGNVKRLKSDNTRKEKPLLFDDDRGYKRVQLYKDGKQKKHRVHRLVAEAFLPNPNNLPQVNHINEIRYDNRVENLEWCTAKYNMNYGNCIPNIKKSLTRPVVQFTLNGEFVKIWEGSRYIEKELGFRNQSICRCCRGERKMAYGYIWRYHYKSLWLKKHIPLINQKKVG